MINNEIIKINKMIVIETMFLAVTMFLGTVEGHVKVFPGGHFKQLYPLSLYESSVPLTYIIPHDFLAYTTASHFSLPTSPFNNPYLARMTGIAVELDRQIEGLQTRMGPKMNATLRTRGQRAIESIGDFLHWGFGTATDGELHSLTNNEEAVNKHLNALQDVVKGDHVDLVHSMDSMKGFSTNVTKVLAKVNAALRMMETNVKNNVPEEEVFRSLLTYIIRLQAQVYHNLFLEDWEDTQLKCRVNLLSSSLVTRDVLTSDLKILATNISMDGYEIALSTSDIEIFYTLPLTSCKISPGKIIVTVKIPVKRIEDSWTLYEYIPSPLAWRNYTCVLSREPVYIAASQDKYVTIAGKQLEECKKTSGLCLIPRQRKGGSVSASCAEKMFKREPVNSLRETCPFICDTARQGILITEVGFDSYIITHPTKFLSLNCSNSSIQFPTNYPGAFEIVLPCDCFLAEGKSILISRKYPCFSNNHDPIMTHILPVLWTSLDNISLNPLEKLARPTFQNFSNVLDLNWNLVSPAFVIHNQIPETAFEHVELPNTWYDIYDVASLKYYILFGWLTLLSLGNLYLFFKLYVLAIMPRDKPPRLPPRISV